MTVHIQQWQAAQGGDPILARVGQWADARKCPSWQDVSALTLEVKAYFSQWTSLAQRNGLLYWAWRLVGLGETMWQLLVPKD